MWFDLELQKSAFICVHLRLIPAPDPGFEMRMLPWLSISFDL
jgi:hypothetical protein